MKDSNMTPKENLISLYRRNGYGAAPVELPMCPSLIEKYHEIAGDIPMEEYFEYPEGFATGTVPGLNEIPRDPIDWSVYFDEPLKEGTEFDSFGVAHEKGSEAAKHMTYMRHPLGRATSLEELQAYPFPEYDLDDTEHIRQAVAALHSAGKAAIGSMQMTIWERAWYVRDMTQMMMDMTMEDEKAVFMLDKITEHSCQRAAAFAAAGADMIELGDDVGMQSTLMMSREMYREWLMPRLMKVVQAAKAAKPDVLIFYHTCGYVEPLIGDLIEAGVEVLNPVQPECMDFSEIHAKYGDRLSFNGTVGTQTTMPFGTPQEVRDTVFRNLDIAGEKGGLLCCPTHMLEPEVPWENVEAYVKACKEYSA
jgi:hypothetical protein